MGFEAGKLLEESKGYNLVLSVDKKTLLFTWKEEARPNNDDYMVTITKIARYCKSERPKLLIVDKRKLSVKVKFDHDWWQKEILPVYHESGFLGFAHITGNPDATGDFSNTPKGVLSCYAHFHLL